MEQHVNGSTIGDGYLSNFTSYLSEWSQYLPDQIQALNIFTGTQVEHDPQVERIITCTSFETWQNKTILLLGYSNGYQIWEIGPNQKFKEVS